MHPPNAPIHVELTAFQWNTVLQIMAEAPMPYRITDPLIRSIQFQCEDQDPERVENIVPMKA